MFPARQSGCCSRYNQLYHGDIGGRRMITIRREVYEAVLARQLPASWPALFESLRVAGRREFELQEGTFWDYKDQFPFSTTDDYFGGIVRLICSFANTYGGLIIFGVHDKTRLPGQNKVKVDVERLNRRLREVLNVPIECVYRRYNSSNAESISLTDSTPDAVDVILVPQRRAGVSPAKLRMAIGKYPAARLWLRLHGEVVEASSADIPFLYGSRLYEDESPEPSRIIESCLASLTKERTASTCSL